VVDTDLPGNRSVPNDEAHDNLWGGRIAIGIGGRIGIGISGRNQIGMGGRIASDSAGSARDIAAQCAVPALTKQTKNAGAPAVSIAIGVLIAMTCRLAWYGANQGMTDAAPHFDGVRAFVLAVDGCSFWIALATALGGWVYSVIAGKPHNAWRQRLRHSPFFYAPRQPARSSRP